MIFSRHFNAHPQIPDKNGTFRSPETIHRESACEMYVWCRSKNYYKLWAYMYMNWYKPEQWRLWARSICPQEIPVLRTTMIVESHWRRIKRDFLHRFTRPRIDLVVWVLISRMIPQGLEKMEAIRNGNHRKAVASWRKEFKQQWKKLSSQGADEDSLLKYHTNAATWTCGCDAFLLSRFLLCKHIIYCYKDFEDPNKFFRTAQRQRTSPFWVHPQLILRPEYQPSTDIIQNVGEESDVEITSDLESDGELEGTLEEDQLVEMDDEPVDTCDVPGFVTKMNRLLEHLTEQYSIGNIKFAERLIKQNASNLTLLEEIEQRKNRHTRAPTWARYKNSTTMYYQ